jgi:hypothetical protein
VLRHLAGRPSKDRHQLSLSCAPLGGACRSRFPQSVRGARTPRSAACFAEPVAETLLHPRLSGLSHKIGQITCCAGSQRLRERFEDRNRDLLAGLSLSVLLCPKDDCTTTNVLPTHADSIPRRRPV